MAPFQWNEWKPNDKRIPLTAFNERLEQKNKIRSLPDAYQIRDIVIINKTRSNDSHANLGDRRAAGLICYGRRRPARI
ncbi:hypothetical protein EVAR_22826_1 [Eumeta japonica]|uniref:Uncharacterized protein n=1 Tax=Eumeta variegata TaxID=151549 RepID=A0A4C1VHF2_EUMVA|nr:hypothetical protein EVAR_22826_1 [Eumeta japonica]